jgi:hypothetical protein
MYFTNHARMRMHERLGFNATKKRLSEIVRKIKAGKGEVVRQESASIFVYRLRLSEGEVLIVYNRPRQGIITILPKDAKI